jgi:apolipoprotein N-acyltransferase
VLDSRLPRALPPTLYARLGDAPAAALMLVALVIVARRRSRSA